jgi:hypothetical protein
MSALCQKRTLSIRLPHQLSREWLRVQRGRKSEPCRAIELISPRLHSSGYRYLSLSRRHDGCNNSSMPSDARSIALSRDGIGLVPEWLLSLESTIRTPPRGFRSLTPAQTIRLNNDLSMARYEPRPDYRAAKCGSGYVFGRLICRCTTDPVIDEGGEPVA